MKVRTYDMAFCNNQNCEDKETCERNISNYEDFGREQRISFVLPKENNKNDCELYLELESEVG
jgi:hypothetical protein